MVVQSDPSLLADESKPKPGQDMPRDGQPESDSSATPLSELARVRPQRTLWGNAWRQFRRHKFAMGGLSILVLFILVCFLGPLVYKEEYFSPFKYPQYVQPFHSAPYFDPETAEDTSHFFPLGTDDQGQDTLARILYGGRISLMVGFAAAFIAIFVGTLIGALAGFYGGIVDSALMRLTDLFISLPSLPLLLLITFLFGPSMKTWSDRTFGFQTPGTFLLIVTVIALLAWMPTARLVRASFLGTKEKEFVEAARSIGARQNTLILRHILPNVLSPIIVAATLEIGSAIITESSLSFLGLGFPYDIPTWGSMLSNAKDLLQVSAPQAVIPGLMIFLTVLSINYIGDGLRDALDPRKTS